MRKKITKKNVKEIVDIMTKPKEPKLIAPPKAVNDALLDCHVKGQDTMNRLPEIQKDVVELMKKYKLYWIEASFFKKWPKDIDDQMFGVPK